jgi:hypothetical protein
MTQPREDSIMNPDVPEQPIYATINIFGVRPDTNTRSNSSNLTAHTTTTIAQIKTMLSKAAFTALLLLWNMVEAQSLTSSPSQNATEITSVTTSEDSTITGTSLIRKCRRPSIIAR